MATNIKKAPTHDMKNMCLGCPGYCCKINIDVTTYDIVRIVSLKNIDPETFVDVVEAENDDAAAFKTLGTKAKLLLKHDNGSCMFLNTHDKLKCRIEDSKPSVCLSYPFSVSKEGLGIRESALCPPGSLIRASIDKMSESVLEDCFWEWERYMEMVEDWNATAKGDESPTEFLEFAGKEMELEQTELGAIYRRIKRFFVQRLKGN